MNKVMIIAVLAVLSCGAAYAGGLETERANGGVKFGETLVAGYPPAVSMNVDFAPAPKAALTADLKKEKFNVPQLPAAGKSEAKSLESAGTGAATGAAIGGVLGAAAGVVGGVIYTIGLATAIGGPAGLAVGILIVLLGGIGLGGAVGYFAGAGVGALIGAGVGAIAGAFRKK